MKKVLFLAALLAAKVITGYLARTTLAGAGFSQGVVMAGGLIAVIAVGYTYRKVYKRLDD